MLFNSLDFFVFLVSVLTLFYLLPHKGRWILLLIASYFFYAGWKVEYLALILFSTSVDYLATRMIYRSEHRSAKRTWLIFSLISNLGLLTGFKYFHFFFGGSQWVKDLVVTNDTFAHLVSVFEYGIPVGISFYTFQAVSYAIDVYRGKWAPERNFFKFALYVSYFPQLVAGPIERFNQLYPQLFRKVDFLLDNFKTAFRLMLYGYFLKMVIADNLMVVIEPVFNDPHSYGLIGRFLGLVLFGIQLYADFFGYSLIALGVAATMGVKLADNFKAPFFSLSLRSFWTRWHITLSRWFTDYIYIPLGGSKHGRFRWAMAIVVVFFVSGLWHGASGNYIFWGLIHGVYYLLEQFLFPGRKHMSFIEKCFRWLMTFSFVSFSWAFFRSHTMKDAWAFFSDPGTEQLNFDQRLWLILPAIVFVFCEWKQRRETRIEALVAKWNAGVRWLWYALLLAFICLFAGTGSMQFVYFQF